MGTWWDRSPASPRPAISRRSSGPAGSPRCTAVGQPEPPPLSADPPPAGGSAERGGGSGWPTAVHRGEPAGPLLLLEIAGRGDAGDRSHQVPIVQAHQDHTT